jgi:hypothetical protein
MPDDLAQLRLKAEACRRLADMFEEPERKAHWSERAADWERLATEAEKRPLTKAAPKIVPPRPGIA